MLEPKFDNCFVCGNDNPTGLHLEFDYSDAGAWAWFDAPSRLEGYPGVIHGGIIATLLDEAMAKIILSKQLKAVTADLQIKYRKPLPIGLRVRVRGEISLQKTRTIYAKATLTDIDGTLYAEATAVYIVVKGQS